MQAVYDGQRCIGHVLLRGRGGFKAFDADDRSLGIFDSVQAAADAADEAYARIERLFGAPRLELFARKPRDGWVT